MNIQYSQYLLFLQIVSHFYPCSAYFTSLKVHHCTTTAGNARKLKFDVNIARPEVWLLEYVVSHTTQCMEIPLSLPDIKWVDCVSSQLYTTVLNRITLISGERGLRNVKSNDSRLHYFVSVKGCHIYS